MQSDTSTSASLPVATSLENPIPRATPSESSEPRIPPLCETNAIGPAGNSSSSMAPLADNIIRSVTLTSPIVLGPSNRIAPAAALSSCWRR
jgi:hypothetical protein